MSDTGQSGAIDPLRAWREWFVKSEREWSEALTRQMKEEPTARAVGQEINIALYAQQMLKQGVASSLASLNLPTQVQLQTLGERLGQLEDAVARVEAGLVHLQQFLGAGAATEPRRDRAAPPAMPIPEKAKRKAARTASGPVKPARPARKRRS